MIAETSAVGQTCLSAGAGDFPVASPGDSPAASPGDFPAASPQSEKLPDRNVREPADRNVCPTRPTPGQLAPLVQPVSEVGSYLASRVAVAHFSEEVCLFVTLPAVIKEELTALLGNCTGGGAFGRVLEFIKTEKLKVHPACQRVVRIYSMWNWSLVRFRARFDLWMTKQDWVCLVNRAKAGLAWTGGERGLSDTFLNFVAARIGEFKRNDGARQAIFSIHRQWRTGFNHRGELEPIPGYGFWQEWFALNFPDRKEPAEAPLPRGWGCDNLVAMTRKRAQLTKAVKALLIEGSAAAKPYLPGVQRTRRDLRFMEEVTFDDVKVDFRVLDAETGEICDLWLLVARCTGSAMMLGFGMRPAKAREDGSQEHLTLQDMKQLCGWMLETYGLPPYLSVWKLERGTATLSDGSARAIEEMLPDRIKFSYNSMLGGKSPAGYREKGKGNSAAKASHESHNRLIHTMSAGQPAQTGPVYSRRPSDLAAREKEAAEVWTTAQLLPVALRGQAKFPILTIPQARAHLFKVAGWMNTRVDHKLEAFEEVLEWFDESTGHWRPQSEQPDIIVAGTQFRTRMESPMERAARLVTGLTFTRVSPEIVKTFYAHTQRPVVVEANGEIKFSYEGRVISFRPVSAPVQAGTKLLAYYNPDDPAYLHLSNGKGAIVGTWLRRDRASSREELAAALQYTQAALGAARARANELGAQEAARLAAMREANNALLQANTFVDVAEVQPRVGELSSDVASTLTALARGTKQFAADKKQRAQQLAQFDGDVDELLDPDSTPHPGPLPVRGGEGEGPEDFSAEALL